MSAAPAPITREELERLLARAVAVRLEVRLSDTDVRTVHLPAAEVRRLLGQPSTQTPATQTPRP